LTKIAGFAISSSIEVQVPGVPIPIPPMGQWISIGGPPKADSIASASFNFDGSSDAESVSYNAP